MGPKRKIKETCTLNSDCYTNICHEGLCLSKADYKCMKKCKPIAKVVSSKKPPPSPPAPAPAPKPRTPLTPRKSSSSPAPAPAPKPRTPLSPRKSSSPPAPAPAPVPAPAPAPVPAPKPAPKPRKPSKPRKSQSQKRVSPDKTKTQISPSVQARASFIQTFGSENPTFYHIAETLGYKDVHNNEKAIMKKLRLKYHPDKNIGSEKVSEYFYKKIDEIYKKLPLHQAKFSSYHSGDRNDDSFRDNVERQVSDIMERSFGKNANFQTMVNIASTPVSIKMVQPNFQIYVKLTRDNIEFQYDRVIDYIRLSGWKKRSTSVQHGLHAIIKQKYEETLHQMDIPFTKVEKKVGVFVVLGPKCTIQDETDVLNRVRDGLKKRGLPNVVNNVFCDVDYEDGIISRIKILRRLFNKKGYDDYIKTVSTAIKRVLKENDLDVLLVTGYGNGADAVASISSNTGSITFPEKNISILFSGFHRDNQSIYGGRYGNYVDYVLPIHDSDKLMLSKKIVIPMNPTAQSSMQELYASLQLDYLTSQGKFMKVMTTETGTPFTFEPISNDPFKIVLH